MRSPLASPFRGGWRNLTPMRARGRGSNTFVPQQLGHTALFDANNGGSTTQITDSSGAGASALTFAASTAAPTYLSYDGVPYVWLPGSSGNFISASDANPLDITGDLTLWADISPDSWTGATKIVIGKSDSSQVSYDLRLGSGGSVGSAHTTDGSTFVTTDSVSVVGFSAGARGLLAATWDVDNGSSQYVIRYWTSSYGGSWSQLGTDKTGSGPIAIYSGSSPLRLGIRNTTGNPLAGKFHEAVVASGIGSAGVPGGSPVANFKAVDCTQSGVTDQYSNAWTITYGTSGLMPVVKSPAANDEAAGVLADGSNDYATGSTNAIPPLTASDACTLYTVTRPRATMTTNMTFFSTRSGTGRGVTLRMASATTVVADISDGTSTVTTPAVTITPGTRYVLGVVIPASGGAYCFANNTAGATQARTGNTETGGALTVFANSTPGNYCRTHSRVPYAAVPRALTAGQIANLVSFFGGGV